MAKSDLYRVTIGISGGHAQHLDKDFVVRLSPVELTRIQTEFSTLLRAGVLQTAHVDALTEEANYAQASAIVHGFIESYSNRHFGGPEGHG